MNAPPDVAIPSASPECAPQLEVVRGLAEALFSDARVQACWLHGSFARGEADAWSDVDLEALAAPEFVQELSNDPRPLLENGGALIWHWGGGVPQFVRFGAVYHGPVIADVGIYALESAVPRAGLPLHILFDRAGFLADPDHLAPALTQDEGVHRRETKERLDFFWVWALTALRFLYRGDYPWAGGFLSAMRATLAQLLWLRDHPGAGVGFPLPCGWGQVRTDLSSAARGRLDDCILPPEAELLHSAILRCMEAFAVLGRQMAQRVGCDYPDALEAEARLYAGRTAGLSDEDCVNGAR